MQTYTRVASPTEPRGETPAAPSNPVVEQQPIRVGLVVDGSASRDSLLHIVESLAPCAGIDVPLLIVCGLSTKSAAPQREALLFRLWRRFDRVFFREETASAFLSSKLRLNPGIIVEQKSFSQSTLDALGTANLDLVIQLGGEESNNEVSRLTRYGSWWVRDPHSQTADAAWFWAMFEKNPVFETTLEAIAPGGERKCIHQSYATMDYLSLSRNKVSKLRKISELLETQLTHLRRSELRSLDSEKNKPRVGQESSAPLPLPTNREMGKFLWRWISEALPQAIRYRLFKEHWFIACRANPGAVPTCVEGMRDFQIVSPPRDRFYADPFLISRDGKDYLFFEDYPFNNGKGIISFVEFDEQGDCGEPQVALEREYHLSYPCVFEHRGNVYMVPESLDARRVDLYRALDFPRTWAFEKTLLEDLPAVDPTIFVRAGKLWLFVAGVTNEKCINEELHLFYSDSLYGNWTPHPKNPIVSDVRRARPAGHVFVHDGQLIRPAQDCSPCYGRALCLNRIEELSEVEYREVPFAVIGPEWSPWNRGTHTFNQNNALQVVDGRILIPRYQHNLKLPVRQTRKQRSGAKRKNPQHAVAPACSSTK